MEHTWDGNRKITRRTFLKGVLVGGAASLAGVSLWPSISFAQQPIKIGASLPLTGDFAIAGRKHRDGYLLWAKLINKDRKRWLLGRPVEIIVQDNRSDTEVAVAQTERFINVDRVDLLLGTFSSKINFSTSAIAEQNQMVYPIPSGGALRIWERGFQYIFYFQQNAVEYIGETPVQMLVGYRNQGVIKPADFPKTAGVVHADELFGNAIATGLMGEKVRIPGTDRVIDLAPGFLRKAGIEVVFRQQWPEGFTDWLTLANSIKSRNPEFLLAATASPDESIQLVRALRTVGYNPKALYLSQGTQIEFKEALGDAAEGIFIHSSWHPVVQYVGLLAGERYSNQQFIEDFRKEYGRDPDEDEAIPFALCQGIEQAVRAMGTTNNQRLRAWLATRTKENPVRTIMGNFHWDKRGLPIGRFYLMQQWQRGKLEFIWPLGEFPGTKRLIYPKPAWK
ncbi:MAG: ABC transporter substrate-binding protein [Armatimonadota bacterium]|nr:ABC transporter substrate-binding protein [Armatimonadota bacterium]MDR5703528.1 ABC transporter substrate-binding protein [Armatimonadota bacterium]